MYPELEQLYSEISDWYEIRLNGGGTFNTYVISYRPGYFKGENIDDFKWQICHYYRKIFKFRSNEGVTLHIRSPLEVSYKEGLIKARMRLRTNDIKLLRVLERFKKNEGEKSPRINLLEELI